jgi:hypothetical protein
MAQVMEGDPFNHGGKIKNTLDKGRNESVSTFSSSCLFTNAVLLPGTSDQENLIGESIFSTIEILTRDYRLIFKLWK